MKYCILSRDHPSPRLMFFSCIDFPRETDPALQSPQTRERICEEILGSGFFQWYGFVAIRRSDVGRYWDHSLYSPLFWLVYQPTNSSLNQFEYTCPYITLNYITLNMNDFPEYVFVCLVNDPDPSGQQPSAITPVYVSKEYNVGPFSVPIKPGRFVYFMPRHYGVKFALAEEPAVAYTDLRFNVELHYLQIRKYVQPGKTIDDDLPSAGVDTERLFPSSFYFCSQLIAMVWILFASLFREKRLIIILIKLSVFAWLYSDRCTSQTR